MYSPCSHTANAVTSESRGDREAIRVLCFRVSDFFFSSPFSGGCGGVRLVGDSWAGKLVGRQIGGP